MIACTWTPSCPGEGDHRMVNTTMRGGGVEFVCRHHVKDAEAADYTLTGSAGRRSEGKTGTDLRRSGG